MHELSIAQNIIEIVQQSLGTVPAQSVKSVRVTIGKLTNVLPDSLRFCFEALVSDTDLRNMSLIIDEISLEYVCGVCSSHGTMDDWYFHCPACSSPDVRLIRGSELQIQEIELYEN